MKTPNLVAIGTLFFLVVSCADHSDVTRAPTDSPTWREVLSKDSADRIVPPGEYKNIYRGSSELAGVEAYQVGDAVGGMDAQHGGAERYRGKHPGNIAYHFWDGRIRSLIYSPEGRMMNDQWLHHQPNEVPSYINAWDMVDFSQGSDPEFKRHPDPRLTKKDQTKAETSRAIRQR